ncbi:hypothetical protein [Streptomyces profundus]|uniref:hypothetical protein n=1 Tax=Streptomyces profundus TaxID=2867410 RepID=UPI001D168193|nr:hypothetical protein [Streptomyces sp. MA3_2.13]UED85463.1 hypothetical protein K4G22_15705 [Streptomyces sp. MA3_2.13]
MTPHEPGFRHQPDRAPTDARDEPPGRGHAPPDAPPAQPADGHERADARPKPGTAPADEQATAPPEPSAPQDLVDLDPLGSIEEERLRLLLHDAVSELKPDAHALATLHEAVPMRRRRRRQMLLGTAASVALLGIGAPLMASVASTGDGDQGAAMDTESGQGHLGGWTEDGGSGEPGAPHLTGGGLGEQHSGGDPDDGGSPFPSGEPSDNGTSDSRETLGVTSPSCAREQLGRVATWTETPDQEGRIYGLIRLSNISSEPCRVTGEGELAVLSDASGTTRVRVVDRTEGDRATGLPAPAEAHPELILPPGEAYEVRFAWVPDNAVGGCAVAATPTPGPSYTTQLHPVDPEGSASGGDGTGSGPAGSEGAGGPDGSDGSNNGNGNGGGGNGNSGNDGGNGGNGGSGDAGAGGDENGGTDEGAVGDGGSSSPGEGDGGASGDTGTSPPIEGGGSEGDGVVLRYTPEAGEPEAARIQLDGACSGTIYRTGVLTAAAS